MAEVLTESWLFLVLALIVAVLVLWWVFAASRKTRVTFDSSEGQIHTARRNQALIDSAPATPVPPSTPQGLAGAGEAIAASVTAATASEDAKDDLTRIKGLGPKLSERLAELGVTGFAQIAGWDDPEIDRIDGQLGRFQGRIRRDNWPEQARLLLDGDTAGYAAKFGNG